MQVRRVEESDLPWIMETARRKYPPFDAAAAMSWGHHMILHDDALVLRTNDAWCVAVREPRFYTPDVPLAHLLFLCSARDDRKSAWQVMALVRVVYDWALQWGCQRLDIEAETVGCDLGAFAKRLAKSGKLIKTINYGVQLAAGAYG